MAVIEYTPTWVVFIEETGDIIGPFPNAKAAEYFVMCYGGCALGMMAPADYDKMQIELNREERE